MRLDMTVSQAMREYRTRIEEARGRMDLAISKAAAKFDEEANQAKTELSAFLRLAKETRPEEYKKYWGSLEAGPC